jgi:hypothetical protein
MKRGMMLQGERNGAIDRHRARSVSRLARHNSSKDWG